MRFNFNFKCFKTKFYSQSFVFPDENSGQVYKRKNQDNPPAGGPRYNSTRSPPFCLLQAGLLTSLSADKGRPARFSKTCPETSGYYLVIEQFSIFHEHPNYNNPIPSSIVQTKINHSDSNTLTFSCNSTFCSFRVFISFLKSIMYKVSSSIFFKSNIFISPSAIPSSSI